MAGARLELLDAVIEAGGRALRLRWSDGQAEAVPAIWFCDNADAAFEAPAGQRRGSIGELALDAVIESAALDRKGLAFHASPGGAARMSRARLAERRTLGLEPSLWSEPAQGGDLAPIRADAFLTQDQALRESLSRLVRLGLVTLRGAGAEAGRLEALVARFGFIRETNYGRLFDVRAEPVPAHPAYTHRALDLHTDNPYREPVPSLQLLHAIRVDASGGDTSFVDGFAHARAMADQDPDGFALLAREAVEFRFRVADGSLLMARRPVIELAADGAVQAINLNHRSLAPLSMPADRLLDWYAAYLGFARRISVPAAQLTISWRPGDVVLFDNRRILHGRGGFAAKGDAGRWLQGCYADMDGARATLARLSAEEAHA